MECGGQTVDTIPENGSPFMKVRTLNLLAGAGALFAVGPAIATLTGIVVVAEEPEPGLTTHRVYAQFSEPDDLLVAVGGTAATPLQISVTGGTFYQHAFGNDVAPLAALIGPFPSLAWDTFITIGIETNEGLDSTLLLPPWPGFEAATLSMTNAGWFITPVDAQGAPDNDGRVLLGQFTSDGSGIEGSFLIQFVTGGVHMQGAVGFCHSNQEGPCLEGDVDGDNLVTIDDFLALLADWGSCKGCPADIDGDGTVGINDFLTLLGNWTTISPVPTGDGVDADLNGDGVVNVMDLLILLGCHGPAIDDCVVADIDGDRAVGATDLLLLIANWS